MSELGPLRKLCGWPGCDWRGTPELNAGVPLFDLPESEWPAHIEASHAEIDAHYEQVHHCPPEPLQGHKSVRYERVAA
jgi:hypothetical protein